MQPTDLIIFGASGDLSARKLFPALYHLSGCELLPESFRIAAVARDAVDTNAFLAKLKERMQSSINEAHWSEERWTKFASYFTYLQADFSDAKNLGALSKWLDDTRVSLFYLATPPSLFAPICDNLSSANCLTGDCRIVLEKPIGEDLSSSEKVNETVGRYFPEGSIYRIDHYLGKETVQNLLVLRFANRFINAQWDQSCIDHVQITVAETVGIEGRWSYYDKVGQLRDMVQNHLMQLLCLVAMEPPNSMSAESIRDEKVKIVKALRPIDVDTVADHVVRGQYGQGWSQGVSVPSYAEEEGCTNPDSDTETFVAIKAHIDNWRWAGVPFYLRTGKRMAEKMTEIVITYKKLPHNIFSGGDNIPNSLVIRLQPNEGIEMKMVAKKQTLKDKLGLVTHDLNLDFLGSSEMNRIPDAYERLFLDAINGDQSLFVGRSEIEESWRWCDTLIKACQLQNIQAKQYHAGSWGPAKAELLIEKDGRSWHE
jgi:glucose-6-phosphate 1-dehydrogenase